MGDSRKDCPLIVDCRRSPALISTTKSCAAELRDRSLPSSKDFIRYASFSPDGQLAAALSDSGRMSLLSLNGQLSPYHYYCSSNNNSSCADGSSEAALPAGQVEPLNLEPVASFHLAESASDVAWHPASQYCYPETIGLAVSMRDHPIHILNMHGDVTSSFHPRNHVDELDHSQSLAFHFLGHRLYAGGEKKIRWFDIETRQEGCFATHRKYELFGQKGLISTLAFNPDQSTAFSAGSFDGTVSIYIDGAANSVLDIPSRGFQVSQTMWSPCGRYLYVRGRKHDLVHCWDIRGSKREVGTMLVSNSTQQRFSMSLDPWGKFLAAGDDKGFLHLYDTNTFELKSKINCGASPGSRHPQAVNSVAFHPFCSLLLASTGSRTFRDVAAGGNEDVMECPVSPSSSWSNGNGNEDEDEDEEDIILAIREKRRKLNTSEPNRVPSVAVPHGSASQQTRPMMESELQIWTLPFSPKLPPDSLLSASHSTTVANEEQGFIREVAPNQDEFCGIENNVGTRQISLA